MGAGGYLLGAAVLAAIVVPMAALGVLGRRRWFADRAGADARLVEAVLGVIAILAIGHVLGAIGILGRVPLAIVCLLAGAAGVLLDRRRPAPVAAGSEPSRPIMPSRGGVVAAVVLAAVVGVAWAARIADAIRAGIFSVDSRQYHLPFAAHFVQEGSIVDFHVVWFDPIWSYYPSDGELFHAMAILPFGRDILTPFVNVGWLALAFLAAWCCGRRWGAGPFTLTAVAVLMATPNFAFAQPGSALTDTMAIAMLLTAVALLLSRDRSPAVIALAAGAAGVAIGTKVTLIAPVVALTAVVLIGAWRARDRRAGVVWAVGIAVTGAFWYVRNLILVGSPLPAVALPGLPQVDSPILDANGRSVAHYLSKGWFWRDTVPDGLWQGFGRTWPLLLLLAVGGVALLVTRRWRPPDAALLAAPAVVGFLAYVVTPASAYGPEGDPWLFPQNLRYASPALALGLVLTGIVVARSRPAALWGWIGLSSVVVLTSVVLPTQGRRGPLLVHPSAAFAGVLVAAAVGAVVVAGLRAPRVALPLGLATLALLGGGLGLLQRDYLRHRYTNEPVGQWARSVHDADIAMAGMAEQYPLDGVDLSNRVVFVGEATDDGGWATPGSCEAWRAALVDGRFDFVVTGRNGWGIHPVEELGWTAQMPGASEVVHVRTGTIFEVAVYRLDPATAGVGSC